MGLLCGLMIGLYFGCFIGIYLMWRISANGNTNCDDYEREMHCNSADKLEVVQ